MFNVNFWLSHVLRAYKGERKRYWQLGLLPQQVFGYHAGVKAPRLHPRAESVVAYVPVESYPQRFIPNNHAARTNLL